MKINLPKLHKAGYFISFQNKAGDECTRLDDMHKLILEPPAGDTQVSRTVFETLVEGGIDQPLAESMIEAAWLEYDRHQMLQFIER